ncbi:MAG: dihydropteroate synthase, partial [Lachnospiraceae bacterium]|nr:dihydropteroate synthase [Lachnospiraceae bacterium]
MVSSFTHAVFFGEKTVLIGERINPTGKKRFKKALIEHDINYILEEGLSQQKAGADILDVNVGLPEIDEVAMMKEVVSELQAISDLPLQIDTGDEKALESALRIYNGKPMINSVNGRKEIQDKVFPLAKKYGGLIVGLTIGEEGVPDTVERRVEIAREIYERAAEYGIEKKNIIIDPLAMAVSADDNSGRVTLEAVRRIHDELHGLTSLGVSNISFGLPERGTLNSSFLLMTMTAGLSAAIMNPFSA